VQQQQHQQADLYRDRQGQAGEQEYQFYLQKVYKSQQGNLQS